MGQHWRDTHSLQAALYFLCDGCTARSVQHRFLPTLEQCCSSSPGQVGGDVPSLGLACVCKWTPQVIHSHCISYPPPTLLRTPTHHNIQRVERGAETCLTTSSSSWGQRQDRRARAPNKAGRSLLGSPSCLPSIPNSFQSPAGLRDAWRSGGEPSLPSGKAQLCRKL